MKISGLFIFTACLAGSVACSGPEGNVRPSGSSVVESGDGASGAGDAVGALTPGTSAHACDASAPCTPKTCCPADLDCGTIPDGCGGTITCGPNGGGCPAPDTCGGSGTPNVCGCAPTTCAAQGTDCGTIPDGCGGTLDCGTCSGLFTCGGGGTPNHCGCHMGCTFTTCADLGADCGTIDDGCGGTFDCGTCSPPATCGGGGTPNVCGCTPTTCAAQGACGTIPDGCGGTLDCGACHPGCPESLAYNFNGTPIAAGDTIWFTSVAKVQGGSGAVTLYMTNGSIVVSGQGVSQTIAVPDATITISSSVSTATLSFNGSWSEAVPPHTAGNIFLDGAAFTLPASWPGGIHSVTWTASFGASQPGVSVNWQWGAAVYTHFGSLGSLGVKPVDDNQASAYKSSDHAGTPENFKAYVVGGASGGGGSNFTGSYSGTLGFPVCPN